MTTLKPDYEAVFKEGFRLGLRLTRAKVNHEKARECEKLNDAFMADFYKRNAKRWRELAENAGRKFTPSVAHETNQLKLDLGDTELLDANNTFERKKA